MFKITIFHKLFFSLLVACLLIAAATIYGASALIDFGFRDYSERAELSMLKPAFIYIEEEYGRTGGLEFLVGNPRRAHHELLLALGRHRENAPPPERLRPRGEPLHPPPVEHGHEHELPGRFAGEMPPRVSMLEAELVERLCVFDPKDNQLLGRDSMNLSGARKTLHWQGKEICYVRLRVHPGESELYKPEFQKKLIEYGGVVFAIAIFVSIGGAVFLSRHLLAPVKRINHGFEALAGGDFSARVEQERDDELGELTRNFNQLALSLSKLEQSRMQWMTDTSHELRTPIAILRAQIEAFQDGVRKVSPKTLSVLHGEIMALNRLVDQLYDLSRADMGRLSCRFSSYDPTGLILESLESFEGRYEEKGVALEAEIETESVVQVRCDADLLKQLFTNLLENSLRYTNPGGKLVVSALVSEKTLVIRFDDTEPGVPDELCGRLFERFYRVDSSRSRQLGGSGLGLSICKHIVESHSGEIDASLSPIGGLRIEIRLPLEVRGE